MIRTIITPHQQDISITIPHEFIGRQVEVLIYASDEIHEENPGKSAAKLRGKLNLTDKQHEDFQRYVKDTREEWNRTT